MMVRVISRQRESARSSPVLLAPLSVIARPRLGLAVEAQRTQPTGAANLDGDAHAAAIQRAIRASQVEGEARIVLAANVGEHVAVRVRVS
jgi:hypothetical protein